MQQNIFMGMSQLSHEDGEDLEFLCSPPMWSESTPLCLWPTRGCCQQAQVIGNLYTSRRLSTDTIEFPLPGPASLLSSHSSGLEQLTSC